MQRQKLPKDEKYLENLLKMRERVFKLKKHTISPIDRGWTGGHPEGRRIGPPDPVGDRKWIRVFYKFLSMFRILR